MLIRGIKNENKLRKAMFCNIKNLCTLYNFIDLWNCPCFYLWNSLWYWVDELTILLCRNCSRNGEKSLVSKKDDHNYCERYGYVERLNPYGFKEEKE